MSSRKLAAMEVPLTPHECYAIVSDIGCTVSYLDGAGVEHALLTVPPRTQQIFVCVSPRTLISDEDAVIVAVPRTELVIRKEESPLHSVKHTMEASDNCNAAWFKLHPRYNPGGKLREVHIPTRTATRGDITKTPIFLAVWYEEINGTPRFLGCSTDSSTYAVNNTYVWHFDDLELPENAVLRFCAVPDRETDWATNSVMGLRSHARPADDTISSAHLSGALSLVVECYLMTSFTESEAMGLSELLAHKDELLALLSTTTTAE